MKWIRNSKIWILTYLLLSVLDAAEQKLVKRTVLILDFVNQNKAVAAEYLSVSIPDALIDPLKKTNSFILLNRSLGVKTAKQMQLPTQIYDESLAAQLGEKAGADVVIMGNYVVVGNKVLMTAKAVDVHEKRVQVSKSKNGKLDSSIFDVIHKLAKEMASEMKEKLPPIPPRVITKVIVKEKGSLFSSKNLFSPPRIYGFFDYSVTLPEENKFIGGSVGGEAAVLFRIWYLVPYFEFGYRSVSVKTRITKMDVWHGLAGLAFPIFISRVPVVKNMNITPYLASGFFTGKIITYKEIPYFVTGFTAGVLWEFPVWREWYFALSTGSDFFYDSDSLLIWPTFQFGIGYYF